MTMKIILSRKGFDSGYGGYPSPILPDNTLISLPIPDKGSCCREYSKILLPYNKCCAENAGDLMELLKIKATIGGKEFDSCHFDPDLIKGAFGQAGTAQSHLENMGVGIEDLFLFFGWFKETMWDSGKLRYKGEDWHVIFGYLQVGEVVQMKENCESYKRLDGHPHYLAQLCEDAPYEDLKKCKEKMRQDCKLPGKNTIYLANNTLTFNRNLPGYGTFKFNDKLRLTGDGMTRSRWNLDKEIFGNTKISFHSDNSWMMNKEKKPYFQSACIGQEFVINDCGEKVINWVKEIFSTTKDADGR